MLTFLVLFSSVLGLGVRGLPGLTGFGDLSVRTIQFSSGHVERLPVAAIERLRTATPLPRPLTPESFSVARKSLADISVLTASVISDEAIERLQGHFQRKLWGPGYVDITESSDHPTLFPRANVSVPQYATPDPAAHSELQPMLAMVNSTEIRSYVAQLSTAYKTRYYLSPNARGMLTSMLGVLPLTFLIEPAAWIRSQFTSWLGDAQSKFAENGFNQPNVIGRIEAKYGDPNAPIVILGAHLDSTSQNPMESAPGADDGELGNWWPILILPPAPLSRCIRSSDHHGYHAYSQGQQLPRNSCNRGSRLRW